MRVYCPICGHVSRIDSRDKVSSTFSRLYCICLDPHCGHGFVCTLEYSHTTSPSAFDLPPDIRAKLPEAKNRKQVQQLLLLGV